MGVVGVGHRGHGDLGRLGRHAKSRVTPGQVLRQDVGFIKSLVHVVDEGELVAGEVGLVRVLRRVGLADRELAGPRRPGPTPATRSPGRPGRRARRSPSAKGFSALAAAFGLYFLRIVEGFALERRGVADDLAQDVDHAADRQALLLLRGVRQLRPNVLGQLELHPQRPRGSGPRQGCCTAGASWSPDQPLDAYSSACRGR